MFKRFWVPHESNVYELVELVSETDTEMLVVSIQEGLQRTVSKADAKVADESHLKGQFTLSYPVNVAVLKYLFLMQITMIFAS